MGKKLLNSLGIIWGIVTLLFLIFYALGDPTGYLVEEKADEATREAVRKRYGLDQPIGIQYALYLNRLSPVGWVAASESSKGTLPLLAFAAGSVALKAPALGISFRSNEPVAELVASHLEGTALLALAAMCVAVCLGIPAGAMAAVNKDKWPDKAILTSSVLGISAPSFFVGVCVMWLFAIRLHPYTGLPSSGYLFQENIFEPGRTLEFSRIVLPAIALGIRPLAVIVQLMRSSMLDVMQSDFVRTARAKGLGKSRVIVRHALRNALNPVVSSVTSWLASLLAGAFFIEYIFNWPGIGQLTISALERRDLPVILGCALTVGMLFTLINALTDFLYQWLDPRVRPGT